MRFHANDEAASPLVVILTFVAGAVLITALGYALLFDRPEDRLQVVAVEEGEARFFEVTHAQGGLSWEDVTLRFLDRAGTDQAATFLQPPTGDVGVGDRIAVAPAPPAGTYFLLVLQDGHELSRFTLEI